MNDILLELRHVDAAPSYLRNIIDNASATVQVMARAADEIERLRTELNQLKAWKKKIVAKTKKGSAGSSRRPIGRI